MNVLGETLLDTVEGKIVNEKGDSVVKRYTRGRFLGKGGFAKCFEFKDLETGKLLAAKIIDKLSLNKERSKQKLASEINIHKSLKHPGIVRFESHFEDSTNVYILLELCPNQTLKDLLKRRKRLTELEAQCYLAQLIPALQYLHESNVIHRDLKFGNLFLGKNMELKIGDFGLAAKLSHPTERRKTVCGTPNYIAPEILSSKRGTELVGHSFEVDIWATGIILYTMLVGRPPFEARTVKLTYRNIWDNEYSIPREAGLSPEATSLIQRILVHAPDKRPKLSDIMNDPFLTKNPIPRTMPILTLSCPPAQPYTSKAGTGEQSQIGGTALDKTASTTKFGSSNASGNILRTEQFVLTGRNLVRSSSNNFVAPVPERSVSRQVPTSTVSSPLAVASQDPFRPVYVALYLDYTERYGVGYMLTNGTLGFFFNDMSNILLVQNRTQYAYCDWYARGKTKEQPPRTYELTEYPKELEKKVRVFLQFRQWYDASKREVAERRLEGRKDTDPEERLVGVKKVIKTNGGLLFRLSNHIVQMCFNDKAEMVICFRTKHLILISKRGEKQTFAMSKQLLQSGNEEAGLRLKYVLHLVGSLCSTRTHGRHGSSGKFKPFRLNAHK